ncbi:hypothetical protein PVAND_015612 [Polypedilum vanderplanki]|uniref:Uncharacterized protein n=1 Tax=Polypedilum vanderplanki TaxID=319348 RepID=A0A9J6BDM0_POLVA|nr:hypothetical protein PVAND_015612 [Polypedilum vanderplanki]
MSKIDLQPLNELLSHQSIKERKLYVVGNYGETDVLNGVILNELYENFDSVNSPDCLLQRSKFTSLLSSDCTKSSNQDSTSIQLWNDIFLYESQNKSKIAIIFINFKAITNQSKFESRIYSAFSSFVSSIYFFLGEESFYNEYFGRDAQECDFHFNIEENDKRNEIDESILEIHSILSHQNFEMHEDLHFTKEDLSSDNFLALFSYGIETIDEILTKNDKKMKKFVEFLKENLKQYKNAQELRESAIEFYIQNKIDQNPTPEITTEKLQRKMKIFNKKLKQIERISAEKFQNFITEITKVMENGQENLNGDLEKQSVKFFDNSLPIEEKIRTGNSRNYIKILQKLFETSNREIRKSEAFKKQMKEGKVSIPLPCDYKC